MALREVYNQLKAQAEQKATVSDEIRNQRIQEMHEHFERVNKESRGEWDKQVVLLKELQGIGVIGIIEEFTGEKMEIVEKDGHESIYFDAPRDDPEKWDELAKSGEPIWGWETVEPHLSTTTREWGQNLRIKVGQADFEINSGGSLDGDAVIVSYSPSRELQIMGKQITFKGALPQDPVIRTNLVERKLAEALVNPIPRGNVRSILSPDVFRPRVPA